MEAMLKEAQELCKSPLLDKEVRVESDANEDYYTIKFIYGKNRMVFQCDIKAIMEYAQSHNASISAFVNYDAEIIIQVVGSISRLSNQN